MILFHPLVIHGSGGNQSSNQRRRALAMRFLGDDVVWDSRPGTFIEKETIQEILPELNLKTVINWKVLFPLDQDLFNPA